MAPIRGLRPGRWQMRRMVPQTPGDGHEGRGDREIASLRLSWLADRAGRGRGEGGGCRPGKRCSLWTPASRSYLSEPSMAPSTPPEKYVQELLTPSFSYRSSSNLRV